MEKIPEVLSDDIIDVLISMSQEQPPSNEWIEIVEKLTASHMLQISSRISFIQTEQEKKRKASMSEEEKSIEEKKRNFARKNVKDIFFGNMSRPENPQ